MFPILLLTACPNPNTKADPQAEERRLLIDELDAELRDRADWLLPSAPTDGDWWAFPQAEANPLTDAKVALGRALFYEPGLASDPENLAFRAVSCSTCHDPDAGFGSGQVPGRGIGWGGEGRGLDRRVQAELDIEEVDFSLLNDLRVVNLAWTAEVAGWAGGFDPASGIYPPVVQPDEGVEGLELFVEAALIGHGFFPIASQVVPPDSVLLEGPYDGLIAAAFPELGPDDRMSRRQVAFALAAYVRSIVTDEAPFQAFLRMDPTAHPDEVPLSTEALRGGVLFFGAGRCVACHSGPSLASDTYHNVGARAFDNETQIPGYLPEDPEGEDGWGTVAQRFDDVGESMGRARVTGDLADWGKHIVPTVYGAGAAGVLHYGHGAAHHDLASMVRHLTGGHDPARNPTLDPSMLAYLDPILYGSGQPFLTNEQVQDLVTFIEEGLSDPTLADRHRPDAITLGGYCAITNDALSRSMSPGCEYAREP